MNGLLQDSLAQLTDIQLQAASWQEGAILVLAGPGSGKTKVLTTRIARLLDESKGQQWRVLALTFTNRAADEMRARVSSLAPEEEGRLFIGTFHSFAAEVLRQGGTHIGIRTDFKVYTTQADRVVLLREALRAKNVHEVGDLAKLLPIIDKLRDRLSGPEASAKFFRDADAGRRVSVAYAAFNDYLQSQNVVDVSGLIYWAHQLLTKYPTLANRYRATYPFVCVDEFQDTNAAQFELLRALVRRPDPNLMVVADDDQIIYQWNGASHKRIEQFVDVYQPEKIQLPTNFRCPPEVVEIANRLVSCNSLRAAWKQPILSGRQKAGANPIRVLSFADELEEAAWIASEVSGLAPSNRAGVAVLARTKAILENVQRAMAARGVESRIVQRRDSFASIPFIWLHASLLTIDRRSDATVFATFVESGNKLFGVDVDVDRLIAEAESKNGDLLRAWLDEMSARQLGRLSQELFAAAASFADRFDFIAYLGAVQRVFHDHYKHLKGEYASFDEDARAWADLRKEIGHSVGAGVTLDRFLQELEMRSKEPPLSLGVVPLLTIHSSKGNEFSHVYLAGLAEDILPSFQSKKSGDESPEMEEERRNCFVAITRTRERLTLTYPKSYKRWRKDPSRFLSEMGLLMGGND